MGPRAGQVARALQPSIILRRSSPSGNRVNRGYRRLTPQSKEGFPKDGTKPRIRCRLMPSTNSDDVDDANPSPVGLSMHIDKSMSDSRLFLAINLAGS
jgi:hypothetical protein